MHQYGLRTFFDLRRASAIIDLWKAVAKTEVVCADFTYPVHLHHQTALLYERLVSSMYVNDSLLEGESTRKQRAVGSSVKIEPLLFDHPLWQRT